MEKESLCHKAFSCLLKKEKIISPFIAQSSKLFSIFATKTNIWKYV